MTDEQIVERFRERVAIMIHDGGLSESNAIRAAYSEIRREHPGRPMPIEIIQDVNRCIDQVNRSK